MSDRLRVLLAAEPGMDGVFRHVEALTGYLLEQGHGVDLAYSDQRRCSDLDLLVAKVRANGGEALNLGVTNHPGPADLPAFLALRRLTHRRRPDIIHAHSSKAGVLARGLSWLGVKAHYFYTPHAFYGLAPRPGLLPHFFTAVEKLMGGVGSVITVSHDENRFALDKLKLAPGRVLRISYPVNGEIFTAATEASRRAGREQLGVPQDAVVIGMIGRFSFQKNPAALYRALAPLLAQDPRLILLHVGRGELEEEARELAAKLGITDRIIRHSYLDKPAVFYHAADIFAMPSRYEGGWNYALLEALAAGLPTVATIAPGVSDLGHAGLSHCWTVPMDDDAALTGALRTAIEDRANQRPNNHRAFVLEQHSLENTFARLLKTYTGAVSGK